MHQDQFQNKGTSNMRKFHIANNSGFERSNLQDLPRPFSIWIKHVDYVEKKKEGSAGHEVDHAYELQKFPRAPYWLNYSGQKQDRHHAEDDLHSARQTS